MSLGLHRLWKKYFAEMIKFDRNSSILDLATGSGDIIKILAEKRRAEFVCVDSNKQMLAQAKKKLKDYEIKFIEAQAENLPFRNKSFNSVTVSFGVRNFSNIEKSLKEILRVLKDDGYFYCLEFSKINNTNLDMVYKFYSKIIPKYGKFIANDFDAYQYLVKSIENFPDQVKFSQIIKKSGFRQIEVYDILSGLASIHIGKK